MTIKIEKIQKYCKVQFDLGYVNITAGSPKMELNMYSFSDIMYRYAFFDIFSTYIQISYVCTSIKVYIESEYVRKMY